MTFGHRTLFSRTSFTTYGLSSSSVCLSSLFRNSPSRLSQHQSSLSHHLPVAQQSPSPKPPSASSLPPIELNPPTMINPSMVQISSTRKLLFADKVLDGVEVSKQILTEVREELCELLSSSLLPRAPQLAIILIGDAPDSVSYVRRKIHACNQVGFRNTRFCQLEKTVSQQEVLECIQELNQDDQVDGILIQLPIPNGINLNTIQQAICPTKDVDVFHPTNRANFLHFYNPSQSQSFPRQTFVPPTPLACIELLQRYDIPIQGQNVVVIGRSKLVGEPIAALFKKYGATVTSVDDQTVNIQSITRQADILVSATGQAELVRPNWIKAGCVILDVGITVTPASDNSSSPPSPSSTATAVTSSKSLFPCYSPTPLSSKNNQMQVRGDVAFLEVLPLVSKITPVPGGIGPTTVAVLLRNTLIAAKNRFQIFPTQVLDILE